MGTQPHRVLGGACIRRVSGGMASPFRAFAACQASTANEEGLTKMSDSIHLIRKLTETLSAGCIG